MPSSTPNRHYPFPIDSDAIDVAQHIEDLARAVDIYNTEQNNAFLSEQATRTANDNYLGQRTDWLKARTQGMTIGGAVTIDTNANGDFTYTWPEFEFPAGTPVATVANCADMNLGLFVIVHGSNSFGFNGRCMNHLGANWANKTVPITYVAWGFMNSGWT